MDVRSLGPLRVRTVIAGGEKASDVAGVGGEPPLTVVLLHGFGAPGDDLVGLSGAPFAPPGTRLIFPEALHSLADVVGDPRMAMMMGDARAWWLVDVERYQRAIAAMTRRGTDATRTLRDLTKDEPEGLAEAREALTEMLDALAAEGTPSDRVVLGGFSQGSMLSLDFALRDPRPLAGLVVMSGTLLAEDAWVPRMASRKDLPVFQSHGTEDPILPFAIAELLREKLTEAGVEVTWSEFGGGHGIAPSVLRDLGKWLAKRV